MLQLRRAPFRGAIKEQEIYSRDGEERASTAVRRLAFDHILVSLLPTRRAAQEAREAQPATYSTTEHSLYTPQPLESPATRPKMDYTLSPPVEPKAAAKSTPSLPWELIHHIIKLSLPAIRCDTFAERYELLLNFTLVSKSWSSLAQAELWRHVHVNHKGTFDALKPASSLAARRERTAHSIFATRSS